MTRPLALLLLTSLGAQAQFQYVNNQPANYDVAHIAFGKINANFAWLSTNTASSNRTGLLAAGDWQSFNARWTPGTTNDGAALTNLQRSAVVGLGDADTNALVRSPRHTFWSTNALHLTNGIPYQLPITVANPESVSWTTLAGQVEIHWAPAGTTNWQMGQITTNGSVVFSFNTTAQPHIATPINPVLTNVIVFSLTRPDLYDRTNLLFGQRLHVGQPLDASDATPKSYVDSAVSAVSYIHGGGIHLQGANLNLDPQWTQSADTNGVAWRHLGIETLRIGVSSPAFGTITSIRMTNTVVWLTVWTNGVNVPPVAHWTRSLSPAAWRVVDGVTNTFPTATGTNYTLSFQRPDATNAFIRVAISRPPASIASLSAILSTPPRTITNATDTTWGSGAGLLTWDTNYVYISVGTNSWKRATLSGW